MTTLNHVLLGLTSGWRLDEIRIDRENSQEERDAPVLCLAGFHRVGERRSSSESLTWEHLNGCIRENDAMNIIGLAGISLLGVLAVAAAGAPERQAIAASSSAATAPAVDPDGTLHVPIGYRTAYEFLGAWAVATKGGPGVAEMHIVYASPGTASAYRGTGRFPDGTVLVKEVIQAANAEMTTGSVGRADTLKGWFVMVKDSAGLHPGNKLWGDGWGWSWFDAADPVKTTSTDYSVNCKACHVPAKSTDRVYINGYLPLKSQ